VEIITLSTNYISCISVEGVGPVKSLSSRVLLGVKLGDKRLDRLESKLIQRDFPENCFEISSYSKQSPVAAD